MEYEILDVINAKLRKNSGFENLYKSIYTDLFKMAFYIMGNRENASDVVSETVLDAYLGIWNLKDESKFDKWILRILTTKCKRKLREKYDKVTVYNPNVKNIADIEEKV